MAIPGTTNRITGLEYLEGQTVSVIAMMSNGTWPIRIDNLVVSEGRVDLGREVVRGWVGLPYPGRIRTLPNDGGMSGARFRNVKKRLDKVGIHLTGHGGKIGTELIYVGDPGDDFVKIPTRRDTDLLGDGVSLVQQYFDAEIAGDWYEDGNQPHITVLAEPGFPMQIHAIDYVVQGNAG